MSRDILAHCWQIEPDSGKATHWRNFRCDRIKDVSDGGGEFAPRRAITISAGVVSDFREMFRHNGHSPEEKYLRRLRKILVDGRIEAHEVEEAVIDGDGLPLERIRAVHGRIYAGAIDDAAVDGEITADEVTWLEEVRAFLADLGWAP